MSFDPNPHEEGAQDVIRFVKRKKEAIERAIMLPIGMRLGCGASGCVYEADPGAVLKFSTYEDEMAFWEMLFLEQEAGETLALDAFVEVYGVWLLLWQKSDEIFHEYVTVHREEVLPAYDIRAGVGGVPTAETERRGFTDIVEYPFVDDYSIENRNFAKLAAAVNEASFEYELGDIHLGNVGWKGDKLVIFDAGIRPPEGYKPRLGDVIIRNP